MKHIYGKIFMAFLAALVFAMFTPAVSQKESGMAIAEASDVNSTYGSSASESSSAATSGSISIKNDLVIAPGAVTYESGQYKVGFDMDPGEYVLFPDSSEKKGKYIITADAKGEKILGQSTNINDHTYVTVEEGEFIKLKKCYAIAIDEVESLDLSSTGVFKVGTHLPAGEYKLIADSSDEPGRYRVYSDFYNNAYYSKRFKKSAYVDVEDGEYIFLRDCYVGEYFDISGTEESETKETETENLSVDEMIQKTQDSLATLMSFLGQEVEESGSVNLDLGTYQYLSDIYFMGYAGTGNFKNSIDGEPYIGGVSWTSNNTVSETDLETLAQRVNQYYDSYYFKSNDTYEWTDPVSGKWVMLLNINDDNKVEAIWWDTDMLEQNGLW